MAADDTIRAKSSARQRSEYNVLFNAIFKQLQTIINECTCQMNNSQANVNNIIPDSAIYFRFQVLPKQR